MINITMWGGEINIQQIKEYKITAIYRLIINYLPYR